MHKAPKVASIEAWSVNVPLLHEWVASEEMGGSHAHGHDRVIVRVTDQDGFVGWGETAKATRPAALEADAKALLGTSLAAHCTSMFQLQAPGSLYWDAPPPPSPYAPPAHKLQHRLRGNFQSLWETATYDLIGQRTGLPFGFFFGGYWRDRVLADYWIGRVTPADAQKFVKRGLALGLTHGVKTKTTLEDPNVERLEAIRDVAGPDYMVTVDPNGRFYQLEDCWPTVRRMDQVGNLGILEDPFARPQLDQTRELRRRINARMIVHVDPSEITGQVIASGAVGGLNLDSHTQGLFAWKMAAGAAYHANLPIWHGAGLDLGIITAVQLHLAATTPNCTLPGDQIGPWFREATLTKQPFKIEHGHVLVPQGPGLGIEMDMDQVEKYAGDRKIWKA